MHEAKYSAETIALQCIYYCAIKLNHLITNMQLQKILYYIQGAFLSRKNMLCFHEPIAAWRFGPVIEDVYYSLRRLGTNPMTAPHGASSVHSDDKAIIEEICDAKSQIPPLELVAATCKEEPWLKTERGDIIELALLKEYFVKHPERLISNVCNKNSW